MARALCPPRRTDHCRAERLPRSAHVPPLAARRDRSDPGVRTGSGPCAAARRHRSAKTPEACKAAEAGGTGRHAGTGDRAGRLRVRAGGGSGAGSWSRLVRTGSGGVLAGRPGRNRVRRSGPACAGSDHRPWAAQAGRRSGSAAGCAADRAHPPSPDARCAPARCPARPADGVPPAPVRDEPGRSDDGHSRIELGYDALPSSSEPDDRFPAGPRGGGSSARRGHTRAGATGDACEAAPRDVGCCRARLRSVVRGERVRRPAWASAVAPAGSPAVLPGCCRARPPAPAASRAFRCPGSARAHTYHLW
jgi:hypothetical protein